MPHLTQLSVTHFRNLASAQLLPAPGLNLIYGENGAGKSSLLEAISVLAHGRSFRTRNFRRLINHESDSFTVFGRVEDAEQASAMGVQRDRGGESVFRIDGRNVQSSASLASQLPLLVINASSFRLLEGAARERRQFFDWLVFHVKHRFSEDWKRYSRALKQRNSLLRHDKINPGQLAAWDAEIVELSQNIHDQRNQCFELFTQEVSQLLDELDFDNKDLRLTYYHGWKEATDLETQLKESFERDHRQGYTSLGPHRAELKISFNKMPAVEILSRGQQKVLITALYIAEARAYQRIKEQAPVFLVDDMPAELDASHQAQLCQWITALESQVFVTGIEKDELTRFWPSQNHHKMFHVKHGELKEELTPSQQA